MREARADKLILFLKIRYPDYVDASNSDQCEKLKSLFFEYETKLSSIGTLNLDRETQAVHDFLKQLESDFGFVPKKKP